MGLVPETLGVSQEILDKDYLLQIAYLDEGARPDVEAKFITPVFRMDHAQRLPTLGDWRDLPTLEVKPPEVWRYFVRVKPEVLEHFIQTHKLYGIRWPWPKSRSGTGTSDISCAPPCREWPGKSARRWA